MATKIVMAIGDTGRPARTPEANAVRVAPLAVAPGNRPTPQSVRDLAHIYGTPTRLKQIKLDAGPWPYVEWKDDRGEVHGCFVRTLAEARDPLFESLPERSRSRIFYALAAWGN